MVLTQKSERAHFAAPPLQTGPTSLGSGLVFPKSERHSDENVRHCHIGAKSASGYKSPVQYKTEPGFFFLQKSRRERHNVRGDVVRLTGVEPVRPSGHKHLKLASLPIPAQPQSTVIFRLLANYTFLKEICQRFFQVFCLRLI